MTSAVDPAAANTTQAASWGNLFADGLGWRTTLIVGAAGVHTLSTFIVGTVLPSVIRDLGGVAFIAWVTTVYITAAICGTALGGWAMTRFGARGGYAIALSAFVAGSLLCSVAVNMPFLLIGRVLQGLGGGLMTALAYGTIGRLYPDHLRPRAIVLISSIMGMAAVVGPLVGGSLATLGSWRIAFLVDVPAGLLLLAVALRSLPKNQGSSATVAVPMMRVLCLGGGALAILIGGTIGDVGAVLGGIGIATLAILMALRLDDRAPVRLLAQGAYNPRYTIGAISATMGLISGFPISVVVTFLPFVLIKAFDYQSLVAGYALAIHAICWTLAAVATASPGDRTARRLMGASPIIVLVGMIVLMLSLFDGNMAGVLASQALLGGGIGMAWAHMSALLIRCADDASRSSASALIPTTQQLAMLFGSAIAGVTANLAGLATAQTSADVGHASVILFGTFIIFPLLATLTAQRMLALTR